MRRRERPAAAGSVPVQLARFEFADWADDSPGEWLARKVRAYKRWLAARREYATDRGLDYGDTFRPEWRRQMRGESQ